jgi:hypothetical protein
VITRSQNRALWILLVLLATFSLSLFLIPAFVIRPFRHQSEGALRLAIALKGIAPALTVAALVGVLAVSARLWRISSRLLRTGIVLANCADLGESPRVELRGQGSKTIALNIDGQQSERAVQFPSVIDIDMQPRSLTLIEVK